MPDSAKIPGSVDLDPLARLRLLESVVLNAHDAVLITAAEPFDEPGPVIQYVNPAFTEMTGYTAEEVLGKSPRFLQGPLSGREGPDKIKAALLAWESVVVELLNYRKDGTTFWVELSITPVCDEAGWFLHWISIQRNITDRKRNEEAVSLARQTRMENEELIKQIKQNKLLEESLSHAAFHDGLTGIRNRNFFNDSLATALHRAQGYRGYKAAVIFMDLDNFKEINDALGHRTGDLLLIEIAKRIKGCARLQDTVARLGGDEFTMLLDNLTDIKQGLEVVQRILHAVSLPVVIDEVSLRTAASIGFCEVSGTYMHAQDILRDADIAMYRAKRQGGAQCVSFEESMHENIVSELRTTMEMRSAADNGEFELYYQPLAHTKDGSIYGLEALIRWNHPQRGHLSPDAFIPLAEEIGLIYAIGKWAIFQACSDLKSFQDMFEDNLLMSVNVSSKQMERDNFFEDLKAILEQTGCNPQCLQLEITESIFLKDADRMGQLFQSIRKLGVKIAFDDFGTGYSSMSYLERYPVDMLKIDQWFVQHLHSGLANSELIQMMVRLATVFGMKCSAEGVEDEEQVAALVSSGCQFAQGFFYGPPVSKGIMLNYLKGKSCVISA